LLNISNLPIFHIDKPLTNTTFIQCAVLRSLTKPDICRVVTFRQSNGQYICRVRLLRQSVGQDICRVGWLRQSHGQDICRVGWLRQSHGQDICRVGWLRQSHGQNICRVPWFSFWTKSWYFNGVVNSYIGFFLVFLWRGIFPTFFEINYCDNTNIYRANFLQLIERNVTWDFVSMVMFE
jgi:hypothetical protein